MRSTEQIKSDIIAKAGQDAEYRDRLLSAPRDAVSEVVGADLPDGFDVVVHVDSATSVHLALPQDRRLSREQLESASGGVHYDVGW